MFEIVNRATYLVCYRLFLFLLKIYLCHNYAGGWRAGGPTIVSTVQMLDPNDDTIVDIVSLQESKTSTSVIAANSKLYAFGGWIASPYTCTTQWEYSNIVLSAYNLLIFCNLKYKLML